MSISVCLSAWQSSIVKNKQLQEDEPPEGKLTDHCLMKPLILQRQVHPLFELDEDCDFYMHDEADAIPYMSGLDVHLTAPWIKLVEKAIEWQVWKSFHMQSELAEKHVMLVADPAAANLKSEKVVLVDAPSGMDLVYAGPVTTEPSLNSMPVAQVNGIKFFMNPPTPPPAGDVLVAAWLVKPTTKKEQVTVEPWSATLDFFLTSSGVITKTDPRESCWHLNALKKLYDRSRLVLPAAESMIQKLRAENNGLRQQLNALKPSEPETEAAVNPVESAGGGGNHSASAESVDQPKKEEELPKRDVSDEFDKPRSQDVKTAGEKAEEVQIDQNQSPTDGGLQAPVDHKDPQHCATGAPSTLPNVDNEGNISADAQHHGSSQSDQPDSSHDAGPFVDHDLCQLPKYPAIEHLRLAPKVVKIEMTVYGFFG